MHASIRSPRGVHIQVTERGLPVGLSLERRALSTSPTELAYHILQLCRLAALRAQEERVRLLEAGGYSADTIRALNLRSPDGHER